MDLLLSNETLVVVILLLYKMTIGHHVYYFSVPVGDALQQGFEGEGALGDVRPGNGGVPAALFKQKIIHFLEGKFALK